MRAQAAEAPPQGAQRAGLCSKTELGLVAPRRQLREAKPSIIMLPLGGGGAGGPFFDVRGKRGAAQRATRCRARMRYTHALVLTGQRACCAADAASRAQQGAGQSLAHCFRFSIFFTMGKRLFLYQGRILFVLSEHLYV